MKINKALLKALFLVLEYSYEFTAAYYQNLQINGWPGGMGLFHFAEAKHLVLPSAHPPAAAARRVWLAELVSQKRYFREYCTN